MWLLRVLEFAAGLVLAGLFLWYLWKVITNPKKNADTKGDQKEKSNQETHQHTHEQQ